MASKHLGILCETQEATDGINAVSNLDVVPRTTFANCLAAVSLRRAATRSSVSRVALSRSPSNASLAIGSRRRWPSQPHSAATPPRCLEHFGRRCSYRSNRSGGRSFASIASATSCAWSSHSDHRRNRAKDGRCCHCGRGRQSCVHQRNPLQ